MDIFTFKKWLLRLFDIRDNSNFIGFPNPSKRGKDFDNWGGVKISTDGVQASVFYFKNQQREPAQHNTELESDEQISKKESWKRIETTTCPSTPSKE